ncbi:MAG: hypothetical protein ACE5EL_00975, partial [Anaerolineae bacterium]
MELAVSHHHRRLVLAAAALAVVMVARTAVAGRRPLPAPADTLTVLAHTGGAVRAVAAAGGRAWIGEGSGVSVLDITDPTVPLRLHHTALSSGADVHSLVRRGDYVYAGATDGVHVLRVVSGGDGGSEEGVVATPGTVRGLVVAGERLLISDGAFGLLVAGLDAPERPAVAWGIELEGGAPGPVAVAGDLVLVPGADLVVVRVPAVGPPAVLAAVDLGGAV